MEVYIFKNEKHYTVSIVSTVHVGAVDLPLQARLKSSYILTRYTYTQSKHRAGNTCIIISVVKD